MQLQADHLEVGAPVQKSKYHQTVCKTQTVDRAASSSDTLIDSAVTVYQFHIEYKKWRQRTPLFGIQHPL